MRVFHFLEEGKLIPIRHNECKEPEPMSTLSLFGRLDDDFISKGISMDEAEGCHQDKIRQTHDILLSIPVHEHAVISFKYNVAGKQKGHFCNILRVGSGYLIIDAINKEAFYRYIDCSDLWEYFQIKLPRMDAEQITSMSIIH
ncbi:MAG: hypothetical protein B0D91_11155 [Oceanospirillales bacterium LUC14_002_19_P2]|nr:MAG: hypothetical protein B0D91_11155 [Oceanospirillales bacterium LUC14_002_19_P2]